jgi:hypothetical protein
VTVQEGRSVRVGAAAIAALASRLTERDRLVALACYEIAIETVSRRLAQLAWRPSNCCPRK